jgi:hypothetical protein
MHLTARLILPLFFLFAVSADRIVRFISTDGKEYFGDAILPANSTDAALSTQAKVITGDVLGDYTITHKVKVGAMLLPTFVALLT